MTAVHLSSQPREWHPVAGPAAAAALALAGCAYLAVADPYDSATPMPLCPFKAVTGWDCPACGGLRMTRSLLYGDVTAAARANVALLAVLPLVAGLWVGWWRRAARGDRSGLPMSGAATVVVLTVVAAWTLARNLL